MQIIAVTEYNKSANSDQNVLNQVENLFAKYMGEETKYTITYNANGGTGTMEEEEASRTATSTFTPPEGKQFKEWNTAADGSGTSYPAGATVPSDVTLYAIWYAPLSAHVQVGDYITYDPTLGVTDSSLLTYTSPRGSLKIKNGDEYVVNEEASSSWDYIYNGVHNLLNEYGEFVIPTGYTVESNDHGNGVFPQTFTATSSNNLWRVLDVNATTGVIKIVPETTIKTTDSYTFYIVGLTGYKNMNTELNNISEVFGYGQGANGARSITVEDVNRLTGYEPEDSELVEVTEINKTWYNNDYYYNGDSYPGANENITSMIYKPDYSSYWLASRFINVSSSDAKFNIPSINLGLYTQVARSRKFILYSNLHRCRK